jgi:SAM-dependent methyltransferase
LWHGALSRLMLAFSRLGGLPRRQQELPVAAPKTGRCRRPAAPPARENSNVTDLGPWHSQDAFWELFEPVLFHRRRRLLAKEEVHKIEKLLQIADGASILDLCCGNGRHSLEMSAQGYDVTGVDRTERYVEAARREAEKRRLNATFVVADMREYYLSSRYDVILNLFGSFGYFADPADDRKVVENMLASLRPGGQCLIETMGKEILAREFRTRDWDEVGDMLVLSEKTITHHWGRVETRWIVIRGTERIEHRVSIRSFSAVELSSLLESCGFAEVQVYGSLDGTEYDHTAERLVVVGRK